MKKGLSTFLILIFLGFGLSVNGQQNDPKEVQIQRLIISFQQNRISSPKKAQKEIEKAIELSEQIEKKSYLVSTKILLGELFDNRNNPQKASAQFVEARNIAREIGDVAGLASCEYNLGFLYHKESGKKRIALGHFDNAIKYALQSKENLLLAKSYKAAAFTHYELEEMANAEKNSVSALIIFRKLKQRTDVAETFVTLAKVNNKTANYKVALEYLDSALALFTQTRNYNEINNTTLIKGEVYFQKKDYRKALSVIKKVEENATITGSQKLYALELLYLINKTMNKTSASLDYLEATKNIQDSLSRLQRNQLMESVLSEIEAQNKLETLEKEAEINELVLAESKYLTWFLIGISILLLLVTLISFLFYRQNKMKSEREKLKLEQESMQLEQTLLRTQMNPHFIANSLAAIQGHIYKQDREKSVSYLSKFAKLMRFILESSREKEVSLEKEILSLENYLDLQKLLLEEKLTYSLVLSPNLNTEDYSIPPMLIQPFVENAIVHGIELKSEPGTVTISFSKQKESLKVTIEDNGLGRKKVAEIYEKRKSSHLSFSTNITNERIQKMNTDENENIRSQTSDVIKNGEVAGTLVELILPLKSRY